MHQRQRRRHAGVAQIGIILRQLLRHEHAFVNARPAREAGDVKPLAAGDCFAVTDLLLGDLAYDVKLALERRVSFNAGLRPMNTCIMNGSAATAVLPSDELSVGTSRPAENGLAFTGNDLS